jgi:hypothetical protein
MNKTGSVVFLSAFRLICAAEKTVFAAKVHKKAAARYERYA